jgi:hypothetical protein
MADGRIVQLGGEVIGPFHESYLGLAEELGLTIVPSFPQLPGEDTWVLADGRYVGDGFPWMSDADRTSFAALSDELGALATTVDPDDPSRRCNRTLRVLTLDKYMHPPVSAMGRGCSR